jgi:hypothetical protein
LTLRPLCRQGDQEGAHDEHQARCPPRQPWRGG